MNYNRIRILGIVVIILILLGGGYYVFSTSDTSLPKVPSTIRKPSGILADSMEPTTTTLRISSAAFSDKSSIPSKFTCDGDNHNPEIQFSGVPTEAESLVLLLDDPDVPKDVKADGVFDHWVVYNMEPTVKEIAEGSTPPGVEGLNSSGSIGYSGPCPPDSEHRYFFKLYALDTMLDFDDPDKVTKQMVLDQMKGHILQQAELIGVYNRPQNQ
jgi:Raf kinase inhibitor-like YbhB/YbcL family protein